MENLGPSNININITPPQLTTNFQVIFDNVKLNTEEKRDTLASMVTMFAVDLTSKKIVVSMDHPASNGFLELMKIVATYDTDISLILINSQTGKATDNQLFERARCVKHEFILDHSTQTIAKHVFVFDIL